MSLTVRAALWAGTQALTAAGITGAARDAQVLMAHALGIGTDRVILMGADAIYAEDAAAFDALITRRASRVPVSHLVGGRMFHDRWFKVTPDVLDPRPETEELVRAGLAVPFQRVLDLGCGSGAIVVSLLAERAAAVAVATDVSDAALAITAENAAAHGVAARLTPQHSDWFAAVEGTFDLIVSNPPYIAAAEMAALQPEVRDHEPRVALTDEADGLSCYRTITAGAPGFLVPGGWLMVEIGPTQGAAVTAMMRQAGFAAVTVKPDMDGRDRVVCGQIPR